MEEVTEVKKRRSRGPGKKLIKVTHDPAYFSNYWREKRSVQTMCQNCGRMCVKGKMHRHRASNICARNTKTQETKTQEEIQKLIDALVSEDGDAPNELLASEKSIWHIALKIQA